jgi:hypothetical protein
VHHPKNPVMGFHGWDEAVPQGSVSLVSGFFFSPGPFFFASDFLLGSSLLFLLGYFLINYFFPPPLTPVCFLELSPTPPTYLPHSGHLSFVLVLPTIVKA